MRSGGSAAATRAHYSSARKCRSISSIPRAYQNPPESFTGRVPEALASESAHFRLRPAQDLHDEIEGLVAAHSLSAAAVLTCVGSLSAVTLRMADQPDFVRLAGPFEIVSLVGTLSPDGCHLHASVSDGTGRTIGGHLGSGSPVYTTAELVVGILDDVTFSRPVDPDTGYDELAVTSH